MNQERLPTPLEQWDLEESKVSPLNGRGPGLPCDRSHLKSWQDGMELPRMHLLMEPKM